MRSWIVGVALSSLWFAAAAQAQCAPGTVPFTNRGGHTICLPAVAAAAVGNNPNFATATAPAVTATFTPTAPEATPTHTAVPTATPTPCGGGGAAVGGSCWYLGDPGASCDATCGAIGATCAAATITFAGSEGTNEHCQSVLAALGVTDPFAESSECLGGFGCSNIPGFLSARCSAPPTTCAAAGATVARACACQ